MLSGSSPCIPGLDIDIVTGKGWQTTFVLVNTRARAEQANLNFFGDDGSGLSLPLVVSAGWSGIEHGGSLVSEVLATGGSLIGESAAPLSDPAPAIDSAQLTATGSIGGTIEFDAPPGGQIGVLGICPQVAHTFAALPALAK
jgi:hypothetical protein